MQATPAVEPDDGCIRFPGVEGPGDRRPPGLPESRWTIEPAFGRMRTPFEKQAPYPRQPFEESPTS